MLLDFYSFANVEVHFSLVAKSMDYSRMDGKQYMYQVRNKALSDFGWLKQWLEKNLHAETG